MKMKKENRKIIDSKKKHMIKLEIHSKILKMVITGCNKGEVRRLRPAGGYIRLKSTDNLNHKWSQLRLKFDVG